MADQTAEGKETGELKAWNTVMSGAECFRKSNVRLLGNIRLLRFKTGKGHWTGLPFHPSETPIKTFRVRRTAWAIIRQNGAIDERRQIPLASDKNALVRLRLALSRMLHAPGLFFSGLFVKRRKYAHFLMLGSNCEIAYRYLKANGFLDSNFFAWAGGLPCDGMLNALRHFDELFTGELVYENGGDIFRDAATGIIMHAKRGAGDGPADLESVKTELRSRAAYLREKFYRQLRDDEPTLAVMKMQPQDCLDGDAHVRRFMDRLNEMGAHNVEMLVICRKEDARHFPSEHPGYFLRTVSRYNPDWQVTTEQRGDRSGWMKIWREFAPLKVLTQKKKYKFDR